jgi:hypothetical protein
VITTRETGRSSRAADARVEGAIHAASRSDCVDRKPLHRKEFDQVIALDGNTISALVALVLPILVLAFWHKVEWGGGLGVTSGVWTKESLLAVVLLAGLAAVVTYFGVAELHRALGGGRRWNGFLLFVTPGVALAIVVFPGAARIAGHYKELAARQATRTFSTVGWTVFLLWVLIMGFFSFGRLYRG